MQSRSSGTVHVYLWGLFMLRSRPRLRAFSTRLGRAPSSVMKTLLFYCSTQLEPPRPARTRCTFRRASRSRVLDAPPKLWSRLHRRAHVDHIFKLLRRSQPQGCDRSISEPQSGAAPSIFFRQARGIKLGESTTLAGRLPILAILL
jgi:hypothetical protein